MKPPQGRRRYLPQARCSCSGLVAFWTSSDSPDPPCGTITIEALQFIQQLWLVSLPSELVKFYSPWSFAEPFAVLVTPAAQ
jgi:hypothetical protein